MWSGLSVAVGAALLTAGVAPVPTSAARPAVHVAAHATPSQRRREVQRHAWGTLTRYRARAAAWDAVSALQPAPRLMRWHSLRVDGVRRRYLLSLPPHATASTPLVIGFHGLGQRASRFATVTDLAPATRAAGQALVLPESLGPAFNDGRLGPSGPADDAFALDVVHHLAEAGRVDPSRVTVTGFSNGAGMAMQLADTHPSAVAAVVSVSGDMIAGDVDGSPAPRPASPVRAVLVHGTADAVQPWRGRRARGVTWPAYISVPGSVHVWAHADRARIAARQVIRRRVGGVERVVVRTSYAAPTGGAPVDFYAVRGMHHCWPVTASRALRTPDDALAAVSATRLVVGTAARAHVSASVPTPAPTQA